MHFRSVQGDVKSSRTLLDKLYTSTTWVLSLSVFFAMVVEDPNMKQAAYKHLRLFLCSHG